jgi:hypothetical protein
LSYTIQNHSSKAADIVFLLLVNVTTDVKSELVGGDQCYSERSWSFDIVFSYRNVAVSELVVLIRLVLGLIAIAHDV